MGGSVIVKSKISVLRIAEKKLKDLIKQRYCCVFHIFHKYVFNTIYLSNIWYALNRKLEGKNNK
ncbi:hypothetical protein C176_16597 [Viridibacillus arenosi FSL R5-213]|uniref:Uncharacterized protein n=1 Tax=Viridibacillus arenosi FSL R5-213 TaxID=1227360 RepID=W4ES52_9BACL|nr:hypothetical protein C176_16597 [Viridibacillus arenosi FSL R5-213]